MADISERMPERYLPIAPRELLPSVTSYCRQLFPTDTQVTCNDTRVEARFELGEGVTALAIVDVDPATGGQTKLNASFRAWGLPLATSDRPVIQRIASQLFTGLDAVVAAAMRQRGYPAGERGIA